MSHSVTQKRPDFHFSESLPSGLSLASKRLLSYERIRTDGTHMYLVFNHMMKFEHIHITYGDILIKRHSGPSVIEFDLSVLIEAGFLKFFFYFSVSSSGKRRNNRLIIESVSGKTEMEFQNLSQVHTRRHSERSKDYVNWCAVRKIRHIFLRKNF